MNSCFPPQARWCLHVWVARIVVALILAGLVPAATHAQAEEPVITQAELVTTGNTLRKVFDTLNAQAQAVPPTAPQAQAQKCDFYAKSVTLIKAYQILADAYSPLEKLQHVHTQMNAVFQQQCVLYVPFEYFPPPTVEIDNAPGGGGTVQRTMPPLSLAFLYMTEAQRQAFLEGITPETRVALTSWLDANFPIAQEIAAELTTELDLPLALPNIYAEPPMGIEVVESMLPPVAAYNPTIFWSPQVEPGGEAIAHPDSVFIIGQVFDTPAIDSGIGIEVLPNP